MRGRLLPQIGALTCCLITAAGAGDPPRRRQDHSGLAQLEARPDSQSLEASLESLAQHYPDRVTLVHYGESRSGLPLHAVALHPPGEMLGSGLAVVPDLATAPDPSVLVRFLAQRLERWRIDPGFTQSDPLARAHLLVVPCPDPDRLEGRVSPERKSLAVDFPTGWRYVPEVTGPWPLHEPETLRLEGLLRRTHGLVALVQVQAAPKAGERVGGLGRHAREVLSLGTLKVAAGVALEAPLVEASRGLPRLEVSLSGIAPAGRSAVRIELLLELSGRWSPGVLDVEVEGVRSLAWSIQQPEGEGFAPLSGGSPSGLELRPGTALRLRGVVSRAGTGAPTVAVHATRARTARVPLELALPERPR